MNSQNKPFTFAARLKQALSITGVKQIELSRLTSIYKGTINNYLAGKYEPKQDKLEIIAKALNVNPVWLMGYDVPMEREKVHRCGVVLISCQIFKEGRKKVFVCRPCNGGTSNF